MTTLRFALAAAAVSLAAVPANAVITAFGGPATGTDPLGHTWVASNTPPSWGMPGLGSLTFNTGAATFGDGVDYATEFRFVLLLGPASGIDFGSSTLQVNKGLGFTPWNIVVVSPQQVTFKAPTFADRLQPGDTFFVNVAFPTAINETNFAFAGLWTNTIVPEPATWGMMIVGFGLVGLSLRRRVRIARHAA